jgi:hypothetical protein
MVMGMGMGVGFSSPPPWTPAAVPGCILYGGAYLEARATRNTAPTIPGAGWSGTSWSGSGLGPYTHTAGDTTDLANAVLIAGNRYLVTYAVSGRTAGTVTCKAGATAGTARSADGTYTDELSCAGSTSQIFTPSSDFNGAVTVTSIVNLSLSSYSPAFTTIPGSVLAQASATAQPWKASDANAICFDGTADNMSLSGALSSWKCLHDGTGVTVLIALKRTTSGDYILSTDNAINTNVGVSLRRASNPGTAELQVHNGSGTPVCTFTQTGLTIDTPHVIEYSLSTADGAEITVDGVSTASGLTGSCSGSNPTYAPMVMSRQSGQWLAGYLYDILVIARRLAPTDPERVAARRYMAALCGAVVP